MDAASENFQGESSYYGADVWECDFSSFQSPGTYRLVVEKIGSSFPFTIEEDVYRDAFYTTTRGLFHHRSGIERTASHSAWVKPIDHRPGVNGFSAEYSGWRYMDGENAFDSLPVYSTGQLMPNAWGGWMDAADFDRNSRHMIAANLLLFSYSLHPDHFTDGELNIPESGNGIPDIIDEAKFCIDLFRRLIGPTGGICGGLEATDHPAPGQTSWTDTLDWYVYAEEPQSSFILAASAAQLAHSLELAGITDSTTQLLSEATAAYTWAQNNLQTGDIGICKADRMHAAAWLYKMTADATYQTDFENDAADLMATSIDPNEKNIHQAVWVYLNTDHSNVNLNLQSSLEAQFFAMVDQFYVDVAEARACRMAYNIYSPSVLGIGFTTPQIFPLIMAYELSGDPTYKQYISTSCDYTLGGNPLNMTWVTGLGARWPRNVANLDSWFDDIEDVLPGIVPYAIYKPAWAWNNGGVFSPGYGHASAWPNDVFNWPIHELYFDQRYSWITSEYTVWQNIGPAAAAYAYLVGEADASTRVDDVAESLIWTVSPNPVSGKELHISFGQNTPNGFAWEVLDVQGKSILKGNRQWMQDFDIVLPTDMTPAVYVLQLRAENLLVSKKILIQ
ncbi:MAG: glycoside hydrolase family 9 protein [Bacteroidota bacterium]